MSIKVAVTILFFSSLTLAQGASKGGSTIVDTQARRSLERFNIIDWIQSNKAAVAAQNAKYRASGSGYGPYLDLALNYTQDSGPVKKDSLNLGADSRSSGQIQFYLDDLITGGNRARVINIDIGFEGFFSQTTSFQAASGVSQSSHSYKEMGGGLLIRPFGRSSQDTGLAFKGGYVNIEEMGLWANNQTPISLYGTYLGADSKIYLLGFLGVFADYKNVLENPINTLNSKWKMQRFKYGAFLEIYLLQVSAYLMTTEMVLINNVTTTPIKETYNGMGLSATLFF